MATRLDPVQTARRMREMQKVYNIRFRNEMRDKELNQLTKFVWDIDNFDTLMSAINENFKEWTHNRSRVVEYAIRRWYNRMSSKFAEEVFCTFPNVIKATPEEDKEHIDFYIDGIPFDLKNTTFPYDFDHSVRWARHHKQEVVKWFYENQSKYSERNYKNKLYITMHSMKRPNWLLKAELFRIERAIHRWMRYYDLKKMTVRLDANIKVKADIIWLVEE